MPGVRNGTLNRPFGVRHGVLRTLCAGDGDGGPRNGQTLRVDNSTLDGAGRLLRQCRKGRGKQNRQHD